MPVLFIEISRNPQLPSEDRSEGRGSCPCRAWDYTWDAENRLVEAHWPHDIPPGDGGCPECPPPDPLTKTVTYDYDALGRRIKREFMQSGPVGLFEPTQFVYDGQDVIEDRDDSGVAFRRYLNGPGIDNKLRQTNLQTGAVHYFLADHLSSTRALTNSLGNVVEQISYDSFGNSSGSTLTRYTYTGREIDSVTGLMFYRARWYEPPQGRFVSEDPIASSINLYSYVNNNPLNFVDPKGESIVAILAVGGVIIGEGLIHRYLAYRADRFYPNDPVGRQKHCYVNCMSIRIHLGNPYTPMWPTAASVVQEVPQIINGIRTGDDFLIGDALGDLRADLYGQQQGFYLWRSCYELCKDCE